MLRIRTGFSAASLSSYFLGFWGEGEKARAASMLSAFNPRMGVGSRLGHCDCGRGPRSKALYSCPLAGACGVVSRIPGNRGFVSAAICERRWLDLDEGREGAFCVFGGARLEG